MTLREHYAGLAMQGIVAASHLFRSHTAEGRAALAVKYADALIRELEKEQQ